MSRSRVLSFMVSLRKQLFSSPASWVSRRSSLLTKNHVPCLVLVHFAASTYTDESILRIHSHLECSRVKEFITLYDMSPRIMGLLRPLLQLLLTGQAFVPLLPNSEYLRFIVSV